MHIEFCSILQESSLILRAFCLNLRESNSVLCFILRESNSALVVCSSVVNLSEKVLNVSVYVTMAS